MLPISGTPALPDRHGPRRRRNHAAAGHAAGPASIATRKIFDYLAVRRPVFALAEGNEAAGILAETHAGMCVAPDRPQAVADGLLRAFSLWQAGRLDEEIPCSANGLYKAEVHFTRVLGQTILPDVLRARSPLPPGEG